MDKAKSGRAVASKLTGNWFVGPRAAPELQARLDALCRFAASPSSSAGPADHADAPLGYDRDGRVAVIRVVGLLTKYATRYDDYFGLVAAERVTAALDAAAADPAVRRIVLWVDSPGGMVDGTNELAQRIAAVRRAKRVDCVVSDNATSGGYYLASQCERVWANEFAEVGCIGVYAVLADTSKLYEDIGVRLVVVSSGGVKGLGADGKVDERLVAEFQRGIDDSYRLFVRDVARGRGLEAAAVEPLADGRSWRASEARSLGLIDEVALAGDALATIKQEVQAMTLEEFNQFAAANPQAAQPFVDRGRTEAAEAARPKPATLDELEQAFPDDPGFVLAQAKAGATLVGAKAAHADKLAADLRAARAEVDTLRGKLAERDPGAAGTKAVDVPPPPAPDDKSNTPAGVAAAAAARYGESRYGHHAKPPAV